MNPQPCIFTRSNSTTPGTQLQTEQRTLISGGGLLTSSVDKCPHMSGIPASTLIEFAASLLAAVGVPRDDAALVATSLIEANLRGHDSHGVMRVIQYVEFVERREIRIGVELRVEHETPALVVCDGQW